MIGVSDFLPLPFSPDLTQSGIDYALRSLPYTYNRMGGSLFSRLRRIVGGVAVELALRRMLTEREVPFDTRGATPFTEPDRYDVALGGRRCDLKTFIISKRSQIRDLHQRPALALTAPALVPEDQFAAEQSPKDLYLFAFLLGLTTNSPQEIEQAARAAQPLYLVHPLPSAWSHPAIWQPLPGLTLKSEDPAPLSITLGGQNEKGEFITESLNLPPAKAVRANQPFVNLFYVHVDRIPQARVGLFSPRLGAAYVIFPADWGNIWLYGMNIWLLGYISREEFHHSASAIPAGSQVFQYQQTQTKNFAVPVQTLHPLNALLEKVKAWKAA